MQTLVRLPIKKISVNIATSSGVAYQDKDQVGVAVKLEGVSLDNLVPSYIKSATVLNKTAQACPIDLLFFSEEPTNAVADNSPVDIADAELASKFLGVISVASGSFITIANSAIATAFVSGSGLVVKPSLSGSKDIWVLVMARAAFTNTSVQDIVIKLDIEQG